MASTCRRGQRHTRTDLREPAVPRLLELRERGEFQSDHVRLVAEQLEITEGTVWRWLKAATGNYAHFSSAISWQVTWPPVLSPG
jgi:hypothetical protein